MLHQEAVGSNCRHSQQLTGCLFLCALLAGCAFQSRPTSVEIPNGEVTLPLDLERDTLHPVITGSFDWTKPTKFWIDTGSACCILDEAFTSANGIAVAPATKSVSDCNGIALPTFDYPVGSFKAGALKFNEFDALVNPMGNSDFPCSGEIGWRVFEGLSLTLDYPRFRCSVSRAALPPPDGKQIFQLESRNDKLCMQIQVSGRKGWAVVDTCGAMLATIMFGKAAEASVPLTSHLPFPDELKDTHYMYARVLDFGSISEVRIGQYRFAEPRAAVWDDGQAALPADFLIGPEVLSHFRVTFDLKNMRLRLELADSTPGNLPASQYIVAPTDRPCKLTGPLRVNGTWIPIGTSTTLPANAIAAVESE